MLPRDHEKYDEWIKRSAARFGLQWMWVKAQLLAESNLVESARSPAGALGLAQFMPRTWFEWWDGEPGVQLGGRLSSEVLALVWRPKRAIWAHCAYMRWLLARFDGDRFAATAAYNWGVGNVRRVRRLYFDWIEHTPPETQAYIKRIVSLYIEVNNAVRH